MLSYTSAVTIALDASPLTVSTGGVGRYTLELALALAAEYPNDQYWLLSDQAFTAPQTLPPNLHTGEGPRNQAERKWWLWGLEREMRRRGITLFHGTDYSVPYVPLRPSVMTLHDLSPWMDPAWQPDAERVRRRTPRLLRMGLATMIITPTEAVRRLPSSVSNSSRIEWCRCLWRRANSFVRLLQSRRRPPISCSSGHASRARISPACWTHGGRFAGIAIDLVLAGRARADSPAIRKNPACACLGKFLMLSCPRSIVAH